MTAFQRLFEPSLSLFQDDASNASNLSYFEGLEALLPNVAFTSNHAILSVFEGFKAGLHIDPRWAQRLHAYVYNFTTRRTSYADHMEFFGSPYLGLQKITFTTADRNEWFSMIFDVDEEELKENLHACLAINSNWSVVGDTFNMSIPYLLYRVYHSDLNKDTKHQALIDILCMYHYKCFTSIIHNDYPFNARKEVALETYNRLSLKYDIKKYGCWRALIEARAEFILNPKSGIHFKTFTTMNDDKAIVYMVGDIQNRFRRVINDINKVFHDVKNKTNIVRIDSARVNMEDEVALKSISKEITQYTGYLQRILTEETSFYQEELMGYTAAVMEAVPKDKLAYVLQQFPRRYNGPKNQKYIQFSEAVLTHLFDYLHTHQIPKTNVYDVLIRMRGAYGAPRSKNDTVRIIRDVGDQIVKDLTGIKTPQTVQILRTAMSLYFVLRVVSKTFYD